MFHDLANRLTKLPTRSFEWLTPNHGFASSIAGKGYLHMISGNKCKTGRDVPFGLSILMLTIKRQVFGNHALNNFAWDPKIANVIMSEAIQTN